jgi:heterodisulfide reductase subunit B
MKSYLYYPGCSLKGTGNMYEKSLLACFNALGITVEELPDWNCCGATSYMSVNEKSAFGMAARNISIAEREEMDILAPCSACYMVLQKTQDYAAEYPALKRSLKRALAAVDLPFHGDRTRVVHPLYMLMEEYGIEAIEEKVIEKLKHFKVFPYYGCLIARPHAVNDDPVYPEAMDKMMKAIGCEVVEHSLKTRCCGGTITGTLTEVGMGLVQILLEEAHKKGANVIATLCPLCQFNLDAYQTEIGKTFGKKYDIPVLYFTQILGLALGIPAVDLGLDQQIVSAKPLMAVTA